MSKTMNVFEVRTGGTNLKGFTETWHDDSSNQLLKNNCFPASRDDYTASNDHLFWLVVEQAPQSPQDPRTGSSLMNEFPDKDPERYPMIVD